MIRTFLRRWWVVNRLYHISIKSGHSWIDKQDFTAWLLGYELNTSKHPEWHYKGFFKQNKFSFLITSRLLDRKENRVEKESDIKNIIFECVQDALYIKELDHEGSLHIMVSGRGMEVYSISYLIFGHDYARKIWTGIIVVVVGAILVNMVNGSVSFKNRNNSRQNNYYDLYEPKRF